MAFLVLFVSCEQYDEIIIATPVENKLSGEELFKSIFFGVDKPIENISILERQRSFMSKIDKDQKEMLIKNINKLMSEINNNAPLFFQDFKKKLTSNSHYDVEQALNGGSFILRENLKSLIPNFDEMISEIEMNINKKEIISTYKNLDEYANELKRQYYDDLLQKNIISDTVGAVPFWAIVLAIYFLLFVHNHAAVAAGIYLTFAYWGPKLDQVKKDDVEILTGISFSDIGPPDENWALYREMLIDELANKSW